MVRLCPFRVALLTLTLYMKKTDLEWIKFLLRDEIGDALLEAAITAVALMQLLIETKFISNDGYRLNVGSLREILSCIENEKLLRKFDDLFPETRTEDKCYAQVMDNCTLAKHKLTGSCLLHPYRAVLDKFIYFCEQGDWKKCYMLMDMVYFARDRFPLVLLARLKTEMAIVKFFQKNHSEALKWIQSALADTVHIHEVGNHMMIFTYAFHYLSMIMLVNGDVIESEKYLHRARECGFMVLDAEVNAHLYFTEGMLLVKKLHQMTNKEEARSISQSYFHQAADLCRSATVETAGTEWCWKRSVMRMAAHKVKIDDVQLQEIVSPEDVTEAEEYVRLVKKRRLDTGYEIGQRKCEVLAIKGCIEARRGKPTRGLNYARRAKRKAVQYGILSDYNMYRLQEAAYEKIASRHHKL